LATLQRFFNIRHSLSFRLIFWVGLILLTSIAAWAYFHIEYQNKKAVEGVVAEADRLGNTIKLGAHYAMMLNARDDINHMIQNIAQQEEIETIRIYNKEGQIKFANRTEEVDQRTNIKAEACDICHKTAPPLERVSLAERKRMFLSPEGYQLLGIISPIYNESGCSTSACHFHPQGKKILGALDVVVSLKHKDREIASYQKGILGLAVLIFLGTSAMIGIFLMRFVNRPIKKLIAGTRQIGNGTYDHEIDIDRNDEIGQLALAINHMGTEIRQKQEELNKQREEYQNLFERSPCYITVQDRDLKLLRYNREFDSKFSPKVGEYCYKVYKNRSEICERCPVVKTFQDGKPHYSEEVGVNREGEEAYWLVKTSPIKDAKGDVVAAMEMCVDVTQTRFLEQEVQKSEKRYHTIFNNIPNPVFVLDAKTLEILDCNRSVTPVYGFGKEEMLMDSFLNLFDENEREQYASKLMTANILNRVQQVHKEGQTIFVDIRISPSEYLGREVLMVTTSDITKGLMVEQQLIQASKMATLGEMATGVAHELNQPLSVIKTAGSFLMKKVQNKEQIKDEILETMAEEIDGQVDRASRIINHLREFGRKSNVSQEKVQVNEALTKALDIFSQQLRLRQIEVVKELEENLPLILADANRLEQVFINLLINARDAIEEQWAQGPARNEDKRIILKTSSQQRTVTVEVNDTGRGIPEAIRDKIFQPFFTTKEVGKGTGLGLSISYGIVQDYNGTIRVESQENRGSNFIIRFPIYDET
jgi:histidine kinase